MKFHLSSFLPTIAFLSAAAKADDAVKLFTSDGVVYSYAVVTSTIAPPSVRVETHYYTTTRVREITMADSEVQTTTEKIISASESTSVIESRSTTSSSSSSTTSAVESTTSAVESATSAVESATSAVESRLTSTLQPASAISLTSSTGSASPLSSSTSSSTSTFPQSSSSTTLVPSITSQSSSSTVTSLDSSYTAYSTVTGSDGKCSVYYDDDEYYSTVYLTEPSQSVDAATTITSTMLVYETLTLL